jgi:uncharacterized protein (DUF58 family)
MFQAPPRQEQKREQEERSLQEKYQRTVRELRGGRYLDLSKDTQFSDAWLLLGVLLTGMGMLLDNAFLTGVALVLFVLALVSRLWNDLTLFGLHYERRFNETRAFLGETLDLTLEVRNQKFIPLAWLQIVDSFPAALPVEGQEIVIRQGSTSTGEFRTFWMPGPFQRLTRTFTIHCAHRGYFTYGPATVSTGDGFGLFDRKASPPGVAQIIVYPKLYAAAELRLPAKNPFGEQTSARRLFEDPLRTIGIRQWQPADGINRVHWKATARHQHLLSRLYEPSQEAQFLIFLNVATMDRYWQGVMPELLERAISVAASLAAIFSEQRAPVGLLANGVLPGSDQPIRLMPGRSHEQLLRILELLAAVQPLASGPAEKTLLAEAPRMPWGTTLVVVSAVVGDDLLAALLELDSAGRQIVLITLAEKPPDPLGLETNIQAFHLPHLVDDLIAPLQVAL